MADLLQSGVTEKLSQFSDFDDFATPPLVLPIRGKKYTVPPMGIKTGLILLRAVDHDPEAEALLSVGEALFRAVLGTTYDEMLADDVPMEAVDRAAITAMVDFKHGRTAAFICWRTGQDPEALGRFIAASQAIAMTPAE